MLKVAPCTVGCTESSPDFFSLMSSDYFYYIDLAKPKSGARIYFSHTSQGHNALPWPGLEPRSSVSQPSALTTGPLNKAMALACPCPWYSWPRMFKVASCMVVRLYIQIFLAWWVTVKPWLFGPWLSRLFNYLDFFLWSHFSMNIN